MTLFKKAAFAALAFTAAFTTVAQADDNKVITDSSQRVRVAVTGGFSGEDAVMSFTEDDLHGLVFGRLADAEQVNLVDTFCVADLPVKTITVTDRFGNETLYRSSEQNCWDGDEELAHFGDFAPRYLDYEVMNSFFASLGLPVVAID